jgi:drug/metabolite transporter (DMT)-like permease
MQPWLIIVILSLIWSSTWLAIKIGLETLPPFRSAGIRFFIAFLALSIYAIKIKLKIPRGLKTHLFFLFFSLINFSAGYGLVYWGEQYINSGLTSVLFSVMPFYVAVLSIKLLPSEKISIKKIMGITVGFLGVVLIFNDQIYLTGTMAIYGMVAILISPVFSALGTIVGKKARSKYHAVTLNTFPLLYTSIVLLIVSFILERNLSVEFTFPAIASVVYLGVFGTAIAFALYFSLLKNVSAVLMSLITFVTPPLALFWGWLFLDEAITWQLVVGMIIIFSGIAIVRKS